ncbi:MAG: quinone-dependent dihydroorotate dehydrogenase [Bacteriovoracaceae bacterium]|nr:quinone-dependent dihydroorotate dehydrogenase [Bacteriovoracaceae bacterium]
MNLYHLFKSIAFQIDPETAHNQSMALLSRFPESLATFLGVHEKLLENPSGLDLSVKLNDGNVWSFPVGLAAGLDKNAEAISFFSTIPFGAIEVGTVTPKPQEGNPKPRMFRLKEEESLLNRMGFNNEGMDKVFKNLENADRHGKVVGVNLGKNKTTSQEGACEDYRILFKKFAKVASYLVINVSSPNTPGLRDLQNISSLKEIFEALKDLRLENSVPLYLKISPDLALEDLPAIVDLATEYKLSGIIATNTTIRKDLGQGGISGRLLQEKGRLVREKVLEALGQNSELDLIGVGGITSFDDLIDFWRAGGKVCQIYTAFIYQGPGLLLDWRQRMMALMKEGQVKNIQELRSLIQKDSAFGKGQRSP